MGCSGYGLFRMGNVGDVRCWGWDVVDLECSECGMFGMQDVGDVEC